MVFLGSDWFGERTGIYETVSRQAGEKAYRRYITLVDDVESCVDFIAGNPPSPCSGEDGVVC